MHKGKGKGQATPEPPKAWTSAVPIAVHPSKSEDARILRLEERFEKIEARQATFETKVDGKFDSIQDALRQILANTRTREPSGETPPAKHSKQC